MLLQYGCVNLNLLHMQEFSREAVYEHTTYVYTKYRLVMRAVYNPATQQDSWNFTPNYAQPQNNNTGLPYVPAVTNPRAGRALNPQAGLGPVGAPNFSLPANYRGNPQGVPAVVSDSALRHALMQPRQQLAFSVGGIMSVFSPMTGFQTDVMNGPTPLFCNVHQIQGTRTWVVDYGIETAINECPVYAGKIPAILSHVWTMRQDMDADFFTSQIIQGRVLFRADAMARMGVNPDNYRGMLALGIPFGTKREKISVNVGNPPNLIEYEIVDRQLPLGWAVNGLNGLPLPGLPTRLKATHTAGIQQRGADEAVLRGIVSGLRGAAEIASRFGKLGLNPEGVFGAAEEAITQTVRGSGELLNTFVDICPVNYHTITVECWGGADSNRAGLETFARAIINGRISAFSNFIGAAIIGVPNAAVGLQNLVTTLVPIVGNAGVLQNTTTLLAQLIAGTNLLHGIDTRVTHDITGKYVSVEHTARSGPILQVLGNLPVPGLNLSSQSIFPGSDNTVNNAGVPIIFVNGSAPGPPGDFTSRGSWTGQCVAAALQSSCDIPLQPDLYPKAGMPQFNLPPYLQSFAYPYTV